MNLPLLVKDRNHHKTNKIIPLGFRSVKGLFTWKEEGPSTREDLESETNMESRPFCPLLIVSVDNCLSAAAGSSLKLDVFW